MKTDAKILRNPVKSVKRLCDKDRVSFLNKALEIIRRRRFPDVHDLEIVEHIRAEFSDLKTFLDNDLQDVSSRFLRTLRILGKICNYCSVARRDCICRNTFVPKWKKEHEECRARIWNIIAQADIVNEIKESLDTVLDDLEASVSSSSRSDCSTSSQ